LLWAQGRNSGNNRNGRLPPFLPDGMVADRSSPSRVRFAAQNAPLTAPGRSAHPPARKEREILGMANQNLLDADRPSHGRPLHSSAQRKAMMSVMASRVENRRSGVSLPVAVGLSFRFARLNPVWLSSVSCSRSSNRTGRFPASGSRKRHTMFRATPSATSEHNLGWLDSSSIPMSCVASCVRL
jgi:hypothetical protein